MYWGIPVAFAGLMLGGLWLIRDSIGVRVSEGVNLDSPPDGTDIRPGWTSALAREACLGLSDLALRRAVIEKLVFTQPARLHRGVWTLEGVLTLSHAPKNLKYATFICRFDSIGDEFSVNPPNL